jgi:pimeloyl-ACP methyl ester carboxylesterase
MAMELRAPWEFGALLPAWPALLRAPAGDGHPVIVFPGLSASDASTYPLRSYLQRLGYAASGWNQGFNFGPRAGVLRYAREQVQEEVDRTGRKVSLIGWSLGGIYARELAKEMPDQVRSVITLGTPFAGDHTSTNAWRLYAFDQRPRHTSAKQRNTSCPAAPPHADQLHFLAHRRHRVMEGKSAGTMYCQPAYREHRSAGKPRRAGTEPGHMVGAGRQAGPTGGRNGNVSSANAACTESSFPIRNAETVAAPLGQTGRRAWPQANARW